MVFYFGFPVSSLFFTCYGGRVAENGVGFYRLVAMPPKLDLWSVAD